MNKKIITSSLLGFAILIGAAGCSASDNTAASSSEQPVNISEEASEAPTETTAEAVTEPLTDYLARHTAFELTSEDLIGGAWADVISYTSDGENVSPQLSWTPVDGASSYVIFMVDTSVNSWVHWKSSDVTETELPRGWAPSSDYVGPYPPAGSTHVYEIYVIALKAPVEKVRGVLDSTNPKFDTVFTDLDTDAEGNEGNIIAYGHIAGTFSR